MKFHFDNNIPIYIQLVQQLKLAILSGCLKPGERLLSVRDLALDVAVNPNTMQKALMELEEMGLIFTERTNGKFVTKDQELIYKYQAEYTKEMAFRYLDSMEKIGFDKSSAIHYLESIKGGKK